MKPFLNESIGTPVICCDISKDIVVRLGVVG